MSMPGLPPPVREGALAQLKRRAPRPHEATMFFHDPAFERAAVKVLPGEFFVHDEDVAITTTLGSCVSACLHDPGSGIGGMNHFMLPDEGDAASGGRFGAFAMELLINEMLKRGARRGALQAKIFGGGQVVKSLAGTLIGEKNVEFVRNFLAQERIPLLGGDVLDTCPRRICLFPRAGQVLCKRLPLEQRADFEQQEARYRAQIRRDRGGEVELFS